MTPRLFAIAAAILLAIPPAGGFAAPYAPGWQVVLAGGDYAQPVFDNAVLALRERLVGYGVPRGNIRRLSAQADPRDPSAEPATLDRLLTEIATLPARPGDRCLVFITSHGEHGAGVWLAHSEQVLRPAELARALAGGCAGVPTVVIVSACYSGAFAAGPMLAPNRIILTAARADRPSFGCAADRTYTVFDECLLGALPGAPSWQGVFQGANACVRQREHEMRALPSEPQAYFGLTVRNLPVR